jgi:DNA repair exonuclease SbcCD ATPase subunit
MMDSFDMNTDRSKVLRLEAENARLREENKAFESDVETIAAHNIELQEQLAAAQAVIEQMREAIGAWERAEAGQELQEAEAKLIKAMNTENTLDALHEARALECERLKNRYRENSPCSWWLDEEAAAHRARKENSHE